MGGQERESEEKEKEGGKGEIGQLLFKTNSRKKKKTNDEAAWWPW